MVRREPAGTKGVRAARYAVERARVRGAPGDRGFSPQDAAPAPGSSLAWAPPARTDPEVIMARGVRWVVAIGALLSTGCAGPALEQRRFAAAPAVEALREGRFEVAEGRAGEQIAAD